MSSFLFRRSAATAAAAAAVRPFSTTAPRSIATINIVGNLGSTPEAKTDPNGREYLRYSVASNSGRSDNRHTSWFNVVAFVDGPRRDVMLNMVKGTQLVVTGDARVNQYVDAEGKNQSSLGVLQHRMEILRQPRHESAEEEQS